MIEKIEMVEKTNIESAKAVLASLEAKLSDAKKRLGAAQAKAADVAFAAHSCDDAGARKELAKSEADAAKATVEIVSLDAAIVEARKRVDAAVAADVDSDEREKARHALALIDDFAKRGKSLQHAVDRVIGEYVQLTRDFRDLERLGFGPTTLPLVQINMKQALATALMSTDLSQAFLAPNERRKFSDVIEGWARIARAKATARLSRKAA